MNGWVLTKLWGWFIVKTFNLPSLTIPTAIGLALVISYLTIKSDNESDKNKKEEYWQKLVNAAVIATIKPLCALGIGSIVKLWL